MIFYEITIDIDSLDALKDSSNKLLNDSYYILGDVFKPLLVNVDEFSEIKKIVIPGELKQNILHIGCAFDPEFYTINDCLATLKKEIRGLKILEKREITSQEYKKIIKVCDSKYMFRLHDIESKMSLDIDTRGSAWNRDASFDLKERLFTNIYKTKKECLLSVSKILPSKSLLEEINRIYSSKNVKEFYGHPVHYLVSTKEKGAADDIVEILVNSLLGAKRLLSGRTLRLSELKSDSVNDSEFDKAFKIAENGTIVIYMDVKPVEGRFSKGIEHVGEILQDKINEYGSNTLFIFVDITGKTSINDESISVLQSKSDIIHITEGSGNRDDAREYLKRLIEKSKYKGCDFSTIEQYIPDKEYFTVSEIYKIYRKWYDRGLRNIVYRAYKEETIKPITLTEYENEPYEELRKLIGLDNIKEVVNDIVALGKMNRLRTRMDLKNNKISMHMAFSGNPGTAKTTVARLVGRILKEEEILSSGHMVECGRQDLVGRYVGWTAKTVEEKFRAARGGILFIDEAYSLVDDSNTYGAEAINTIVQLMENYREDLIVIFAGYPERMRDFLKQNEGMNSRISFHLDFPDYTDKELMEILFLMTERYGYKLSNDAENKAKIILKKSLKQDNFGNGRYVRNLLEQATMHQARRLMKDKKRKITKNEAMLLLAEDINEVSLSESDNHLAKIGFISNCS